MQLESEHGTDSSKLKPSRPLGISLLALAFLLLSVLGWLRLIEVMRQWDLLVELGAQPGPGYLAFGGALWGLIGLPTAWGLWTGQHWAPLAARIVALVYLLSYWLDRLLLLQIGNPPPNWIFAFALSMLGMGYTYWILVHPSSRRFFFSQLIADR